MPSVPPLSEIWGSRAPPAPRQLYGAGAYGAGLFDPSADIRLTPSVYIYAGSKVDKGVDNLNVIVKYMLYWLLLRLSLSLN